ncbi:sigma-70 family RNA polymerase sigma factor [Opitutaceae bacterium TAV4]|nr:sigma-70 family RNA polymerase sigma factor [Opitutaceae bacterium TAV4]RRK00923.1 sigma-70 family RNA polymerase sigma factor [Opitutaceae bacterium TAV3]
MDTENNTDETLMSRIREHDETALIVLQQKYYRHLCKFAFHLLRRKDYAEEAASNVFINIWCRRQSLAIKTTLRNYLFSSVNNQALKLLTRQIGTDTVAIDDVPPHKLVDAIRTDGGLLFREFEEELEALLACMPPQRQLVFRMNRFEKMPYKQIAAVLNISPRTVQNHMVEANQQIAVTLPRLYELMKRGF